MLSIYLLKRERTHITYVYVCISDYETTCRRPNVTRRSCVWVFFQCMYLLIYLSNTWYAYIVRVQCVTGCNTNEPPVPWPSGNLSLDLSCIHTFLDGYCSTVQGLFDWFEVDLGFTELLFIPKICLLMYGAYTWQACVA